MTRARLIGRITDDLEAEVQELNATTIEEETENQPQIIQSHALRVQVRQSPYMDTFHKHHAVRITIYSGAT